MKTKTAKKAPARKAPAVKNESAKRPPAKAKAALRAKRGRPVGKAVLFTVHEGKGKKVYLAGEFNGWDPAAKQMKYRAQSGVYAASLRLAPGTYQYKFVIDGAWRADPENANSVPNDQGTFNSVVAVK